MANYSPKGTPAEVWKPKVAQMVQFVSANQQVFHEMLLEGNFEPNHASRPKTNHNGNRHNKQYRVLKPYTVPVVESGVAVDALLSMAGSD